VDLARLNLEQKEAVLTRGLPLLVLAGPGTGKTLTVVYRIAALIEEGEDPERILAITFTNKAAQELRDRVLGLTGKRLSWIRTIHGACAQVLRGHIQKLGYDRAFHIASIDASNRTLQEAIRELGLPENGLDLPEIARKVARIKSQADPASALASEDKPLRDIFNCYQERMRSRGCIDFNDLIYLTLRLLREDSDTLGEVRALWRHLIVDEVQDCDPAQYELISHLGRERGIAVVGDDDQAIYSFRHATPEVLGMFVKDFDPKILVLTKTYRLPKRVVAAAGALIRNNQARFEKNLECAGNAAGDLITRSFGSEEEEGDFVGREILTLQAEGIAAEEIAILCRTHGQLSTAEGALKRLKIPFRKMGERSFFEKREVRDMMAYLTSLALPGNSPAFERVLKIEGMSARVLDLLEDIGEQNDLGLYRAARMAVSNHYVQGRPKETLESLFERFERLGPRIDELCLSDLMRAIAKEFGYLARLENFSRNRADFEKRVGHLKELARMADQFELKSGSALVNFINEMAIAAIQGGHSGEKPGIRLVTLHGAKGLEFRVVFLTGASQGTIPHLKGNLEEERRLLYVGITRAKERLYITHARYVQNDVRERSLFVDELEGATRH